MRLLVFFDLPVVKKEDRKEYQNFRRFLLNDGYIMLQYSVYSRICNGIDGTNKHISRLKKISHIKDQLGIYKLQKSNIQK